MSLGDLMAPQEELSDIKRKTCMLPGNLQVFELTVQGPHTIKFA